VSRQVFGDKQGLVSTSTNDPNESMLAKAQAQIAQHNAITEAEQGKYALTIWDLLMISA
jgi:hypothetical protein